MTGVLLLLLHSLLAKVIHAIFYDEFTVLSNRLRLYINRYFGVLKFKRSTKTRNHQSSEEEKLRLPKFKDVEARLIDLKSKKKRLPKRKLIYER